MLWVLVALAVGAVVVIGLVTVGRETWLLRTTARPAVFELEQAADFIADALSPEVAGRLTHDDVRWILRTDVDLLEDVGETDNPHEVDEGSGVVDEDDAVARILVRAEADNRDLEDTDVVAVLAARLRYLEAIGAIGPRAEDGPPPAG